MDQKKRHVVSYENMSPELAAAFAEKYPKGFSDYLADLVKYTKPDGTPFYAVTIEIPDAIYLGNDTARLCKGDRVRVTEGLYKGAEGYVKRIRHARKVLVAIQGVAVVALSNIHPQFLEKI